MGINAMEPLEPAELGKDLPKKVETKLPKKKEDGDLAKLMGEIDQIK